MTNGPTWVREVAVRYRGRRRPAPTKIERPAQMAALARQLLVDDAREHFIAVYLDGRHQPIGLQTVSLGTATQSLVHPREVFQPAVLLGAAAVVLVHNHPTGDTRPSPEDRDVTQRLSKAGEVLGIQVLDHVILGRGTTFHSFRDAGEMP